MQCPICSFPVVPLISCGVTVGSEGRNKQVPGAPSPLVSPPNSQCCTDTWDRGSGLSGHVPPVTDPLRCVVFRMEKTKDLTAAQTCGWESDPAGVICMMQVFAPFADDDWWLHLMMPQHWGWWVQKMLDTRSRVVLPLWGFAPQSLPSS